MTKTKNYNLNKPQADDLFSLKPLNENMDLLEAALSDFAAKRCFVCAGSYTGNGATTKKIDTYALVKIDSVTNLINFKPVAVLVRKRRVPSTFGSVLPVDSIDAGWTLWTGAATHDSAYRRTGSSDQLWPCQIQFTATNGSLTCKLFGAESIDETIDHGALVNNEDGAIYDYVAFGY